MGKEIERKFLVKSNAYRNKATKNFIQQGYLSIEPERVVRVRSIDEKAFITIKGFVSDLTRHEFEYKIPYSQCREILEKLCIQPVIVKYRYKLNYYGFTWEIDEFLNDNKGLIVAEIELKFEEQKFIKPDWVGEEVTKDPKYFNFSLVTHPYKNWK